MMRPPGPALGDFGSVDVELCFFAEATRCGSVSFVTLYDPRMSMSMTDLNAFGDSCARGARKFPAAPALHNVLSVCDMKHGGMSIHQEINSSQLLHAGVNRLLQTLDAPYVDSADS